MTWAYFNGTNTRCPRSGGNSACFPEGGLERLSDCATSDAWSKTSDTSSCQGYALARGYAEALGHGADILVPAGLGWEAARGSREVPSDCKALVDGEYSGPSVLDSIALPLRLINDSNARWTGEAAHKLYRRRGPDYDASKYCSDGCRHDHHASPPGMYLNALIFFATLFRRSPIGAAWPQGQVVDGIQLPSVTEEDARSLQEIAHDVVVPHLSAWWKDDAHLT